MTTTSELSPEQADFYGRYVYVSRVFQAYMEQVMVEAKMQTLHQILVEAGLAERIAHLDCMDVGMGRQALCLALMGAKSVAHFDISASQQRRFAQYIAQRHPNLPIASQQLDLCQTPLGRERFDFILLQGVIHHTAHPRLALLNCLKALRPGGRMWLMFYRSGSFQWFVCSMIRRLLASDTPGECLDHLQIWFDRQGLKNFKERMNLMDDLFVPHVRLFTPFSYAAFLERMGCRLLGGQQLEPLVSVDHANLPDNSAWIVEKIGEPDPALLADPPRLLEPELAVDQLDPRLYREAGPLEAIACFQRVEAALREAPRREPVFEKAVRLHQLASPANWGLPVGPPDYQRLMEILTD